MNITIQQNQPHSWVEYYAKPVAKWAPLFTLYKPFSQVTALGLGATRTLLSADDFRRAVTEGTVPVKAGLYTLLNAASVAGTLFAHPVGMLINAGVDVQSSSLRLMHALREENYTEAMEHAGKILSNALYMACFAVGGLELRIATLAFQVGMGLYHSKQAYANESYVEAAAHLAMSALLGQELVQLTAPMQTQQIDVTEQTQMRRNARGKEEVKRPAVPEHVKGAEIKTDENVYKVRTGVAQYGGSDYSNALRVERDISVQEALEIADSDPKIDYFFRMYDGARMILPVPAKQLSLPDPLHLISKPIPYFNDNGTPGFGCLRMFNGGDTVFFQRKPSEGDWGGMWLGSARGYSDTYVKL